MKLKNKKKKRFFGKIPNWLSAVIIAVGIGLFFNYTNASIHSWGIAIGIWILIILFELIDLKEQLKNKN